MLRLRTRRRPTRSSARLSPPDLRQPRTVTSTRSRRRPVTPLVFRLAPPSSRWVLSQSMLTRTARSPTSTLSTVATATAFGPRIRPRPRPASRTTWAWTFLARPTRSSPPRPKLRSPTALASRANSTAATSSASSSSTPAAVPGTVRYCSKFLSQRVGQTGARKGPGLFLYCESLHNDWVGSALRRTLLWLIGLKICALVAVFDFTVGTVHPFDLPKTAVSRALAWILAAIIGIAISRYGVRIIPSTRLHFLIVAYLAANALSALLAADSYVAAFGDQERRLGLSYLLDMAVLYLAVAVALRSESDALPLLSGFTLGAAVALGYGIVQVLKLDPFAWSLGNARPLSTLGNPNMYGQFLSVAFGVGLGLMLAPGVLRRRLLSALAILMMGASLAVAATVATRGTVLGVLTSLVVAPLVYVNLHRAGPARSAAAALVTVAAGLV